ncbi:hypothetical protein CNMCM5878_008175 [Aspergillus fumigatiaffinis]|nr:hypothetical protein CNMCM5878_008165 [Aspergillus fumigatiaffinis]KAF4221751.1 hypothetical protein CNMCM5878_008175 [Aspergillus fumigatiaffinis]
MAISPSPESSVTQNNNTANPPCITDLQNSTTFPTLWYRLHVLLYDLQHFNQRPDSRERLETVTDLFYIGSPYFNDDETLAIKTPLSTARPLPKSSSKSSRRGSNDATRSGSITETFGFALLMTLPLFWPLRSVRI